MYRHWSPISEKYSGGDTLLTAVEDGWRIKGVIFRQEFWLAGVRRVCVFHVDLERDGQTEKMLVVHNPYVIRYLLDMGAQVVQINQRRETDFHRWT
jgi:hypothetical protein